MVVGVVARVVVGIVVRVVVGIVVRVVVGIVARVSSGMPAKGKGHRVQVLRHLGVLHRYFCDCHH